MSFLNEDYYFFLDLKNYLELLKFIERRKLKKKFINSKEKNRPTIDR